MVIAFLFFLPFILTYTVFVVYAERKVSAFMQDRLGPMETGKYGLIQTVADLLKLLQKEDVIPKSADKLLFALAPIVIFTSIFAGFAVMPVNMNVVGSDAPIGVFYLMAIISLDVIGVLMAGWASNNKYSLFGAMRSVAQIVSYEIPLGLSVLAVVMISQTLNLQEMCFQQGVWFGSYENATATGDAQNYLFGIKSLGIETTVWGGFFTWNIFRAPHMIFVFIIFFISSLAEANRAPFDLPESESELIGGYHTEYSGFKWALFMLSEYAVMLLVSLLAAVLFFGGWNTPLPNIGEWKLAELTSGEPGSIISNIWGVFWLFTKAFGLIFLQMWARWTYPRLRVDQLMSLCWKYLIPISLVMIIASAVWRLFMI
ncbi:complex I subunit 1 family protein [Flammeovirgaceae bacterium SG7u.111]|nr:complex I subunit 1 family protein [Flammeovirgaceae bacterium SG7u.132]WPO34791.1 complex I subunit 1 family protein [Flammeovirgaceae bacterium SG7u.111]